ncbi:hypothetical protein Dimus_024382 [Dionaea muscipula]
MATGNPFDLLEDNDNDDPLQLIASAQLQLQQQKAAVVAAPKKGAPAQGLTGSQQPQPAKLPSKPVPPTQAVRETKNEGGRGGHGAGRGGGRGRGGGAFNRDNANNDNTFSTTTFPGGQAAPAEGEGGRPSERRSFGGPRGPYRGGRRGSFNGEDGGDGDHPRRVYERRSGTGRGNEFKREGAGRGNWGTQTDEIAPATEEEADQSEKPVVTEKPAGGEDAVDVNQETPQETEEKESEEKEMTLEEYEKLLEEKRKALQALKTEERKVEVDKEFELMQQLSSKKDDETIFIKLGADKDKRREISEKDEKAKKSVSINEFLKPAAGERYYNPGGRGRGRGRGSRGGFGGGGFGSGSYSSSRSAAPAIEDHGQFPTLGGK